MFSGPIYFFGADLWGAEAGKAFILRISVNFVSAQLRICKTLWPATRLFESLSVRWLVQGAIVRSIDNLSSIRSVYWKKR